MMQEMSSVRQQILSILVETGLQEKEQSKAAESSNDWHSWKDWSRDSWEDIFTPPTPEAMQEAWPTLLAILAFGSGWNVAKKGKKSSELLVGMPADVFSDSQKRRTLRTALDKNSALQKSLETESFYIFGSIFQSTYQTICQSVSVVPLRVVALFCANARIRCQKPETEEREEEEDAQDDLFLNDTFRILAAPRLAKMVVEIRGAHAELLAEATNRCSKRWDSERLSIQQWSKDGYGQLLRSWKDFLHCFVRGRPDSW